MGFWHKRYAVDRVGKQRELPIYWQVPLLKRNEFLVHLGKNVCQVPQLRAILTLCKKRTYLSDYYQTHSSIIKTEMDKKIDIVRFLNYFFIVILFLFMATFLNTH